MKPCSLQHKIITGRAPQMKDTWRVLHPESSLGSVHDAAEQARRRPIPTVEYNIMQNGCTSNNVTNTWRWPKSRRRLLGKPGADASATKIPDDALDEAGHRIDYIFANVAGAEKDGEWEDVTAGESIRSPTMTTITTSTTMAVERKCSLANGNERDRESKSSSFRKRGVHFHGNPTLEPPMVAKEQQPAAPPPNPMWVIRHARVAVMDRHPTLGCSLSDHYGYEVTLARRVPKRQCQDRTNSDQHYKKAMSEATVNLSGPPSAMRKGGAGGGQRGVGTPPPQALAIDKAQTQEERRPSTYLDSPTASERRISTCSSLPPKVFPPLPPATSSASADNAPLTTRYYASILCPLRTYARAKRVEQKNRFWYFYISLVVTAGLLAGTWFIPVSYGNFLVLVVGMVNFAAGIINGLYALLFLGREIRCLGEFEWEVQNARAMQRGRELETDAAGIVGGGVPVEDASSAPLPQW